MKQQGVVLITTLVFLLALMLLGLGALELSQLQIRMSHNVGDGNQVFQAAEAGLRTGEQQLSQAKSLACYSVLSSDPNTKPNLDKPSCVFKFAHLDVHYLIEQLPDTVCIALSDQQKVKGNSYRITAWAALKNNAPTILQSSDAFATTNKHCEKNSIPAGRSSWEEWS